MSDDIPSVNDLTHPKKVPSIFPENVWFSKKVDIPKKGWVGIGLLVLFFVLLIIGAALPPKYYWKPVNHWSDSWTIKPGVEWYHEWTIAQTASGKKLETNISVIGGNNDLHVYVDTPKGRIDYGKLTSPIHITINVSKYGLGKYVFHYDNKFSLLTSKHVTVTETLYYLEKDTSDSDSIFVLDTLFVLPLSLLLISASVRKKATLIVENDVIELKMLASRKLELKINNYKLDQQLDHEIKFKAGDNEDRIVEIKPIKAKLKILGWEVYVDGQEIGQLP